MTDGDRIILLERADMRLRAQITHAEDQRRQAQAQELAAARELVLRELAALRQAVR